MKKVSLFWFNGFWYVLPYNKGLAPIVPTPEMEVAAEKFLETYDLQTEFESHNAELPVTMEQVKKWVRETYYQVISNDVIASTDKRLGLPSINQEALDLAYADGSWVLFPKLLRTENNQVILEINDDSGY